MASITAYLTPPLLVQGRISLFRTLQKLPFSPIGEKQNRVSVVVKAFGESSESSTSVTVFKSVQNVIIDKLLLIPNALELVGILFSTWFVYRYLLFKPDREELFQIINKSVSDILGQ